MNNDTQIQRLKFQLTKDIGKTIDDFIDFCQNKSELNDIFNNLILHKSSYVGLMEQITNNLIDNSTAQIQKAKIANALLYNIDKLAEFSDFGNLQINNQQNIQNADSPKRNPNSYNLAKIIKLIDSAFNDTDLQTFCMCNYEKAYESFSTGQSKTQKINILIDIVKRSFDFENLLNLIKEENNIQYEYYKPYYK